MRRDKRFKLSNVPSKAQKRLPFYRDKKGRVGFNPRPGVSIDYGVSYDPVKGHRVYFNYADTPEYKNTWGVESLRSYIKDTFIEKGNAELRKAAKVYLATCDLADDMQRRWIDAGKPLEGVPEYEGKSQ